MIQESLFRCQASRSMNKLGKTGERLSLYLRKLFVLFLRSLPAEIPSGRSNFEEVSRN